MESVFINSVLKYPTSKSKKKKRRVTFNCSKCGKQVSKWYEKKKFNYLCNYCNKGGISNKEFISRCEYIHKNKYDYSKIDVRGKRSFVTIICPIHGEFTQRVQEHLNGHGCKMCSDEERRVKQTYSVDYYTSKITNPFIKVIDYQDVGWHKKVKCFCEKHGTFTTTFGNLKNKFVCKKCANEHHQKQSVRKNLIGKSATLYFIYFPSIDKYKIGVTTQQLNKRFNYISYDILYAEILPYEKAIELEHTIHTKLSHLRYSGKPLLKGGNTELYNKNITEELLSLGLHISNSVSKAI